MVKRIYFDLDGVLANFDKAVYEETGCIDLLNEKNQSWRKVFGYSRFFLDIEPFWYAQELIHHAQDICPDVQILSATGANQSEIVKAQKIIFSYENFKNIPVNIVQKSTDKASFASPNIVLIDDNYEKSILPWIDSGGIGIHHIAASYTLQKLRDISMGL